MSIILLLTTIRTILRNRGTGLSRDRWMLKFLVALFPMQACGLGMQGNQNQGLCLTVPPLSLPLRVH